MRFLIPPLLIIMDEELKNLMERNLEVSEKTLSILKKMRREVMWGRFFWLAKWAIIIGLIVFSFMKIQPYVAYWSGVAENISNNLESFNNFFSPR